MYQFCLTIYFVYELNTRSYHFMKICDICPYVFCFPPPPPTPTIFFPTNGVSSISFHNTRNLYAKKKTHLDPKILLLIFKFVLSLYVILFSWSIIASFDILLEQLRQKEEEIRKLKDLYLEKSFITDEGRVSLVMTRKGILKTILQSL